MSIAETQEKNLRMYHDMVHHSDKRMSFGMASYWALALLSQNGLHAQEFDDVEDDLKKAIMTHTPTLSTLAKNSHVKKESLLRAYEDTLLEVSSKSRDFLSFMLLAGLDKYGSAPQEKELFILTSGLNEAQADTVTRTLRDNMTAIRSPSLIQECRDILNSFGTGEARRRAADTVMLIAGEAHERNAPIVY